MKIRRLLVFLFALFVVASFGIVYAGDLGTKQSKNNEVNDMKNVLLKGQLVKEQEYSKALEAAVQLLEIPEGYELKSVQGQKQNHKDVWVFRYEKDSGENNGIGGEHFSFVVEKGNNKILGVTWMDQHLAAGKLPNQKETQEMTKAFLNRIEPGLFGRLKNLWVDKHSETITVTDGNQSKNVTITGMKYKCYVNETDDYAWVIVGPYGNIITFEQGIRWQNGRVTEKWLHDSWILHSQSEAKIN